MPIAPLNTECRELGCHNPKTNRSTFCVKHGGATTEKGKINSKLYSQSYWQKQRQSQLSKDPLCAACLIDGKVTQALHIDHVFPHKQDSDRFRLNYFQSLCHYHHTMKTQYEKRGVYLYYARHGVVTYTEGDYARIFLQQQSTPSHATARAPANPLNE